MTDHCSYGSCSVFIRTTILAKRHHLSGTPCPEEVIKGWIRPYFICVCTSAIWLFRNVMRNFLERPGVLHWRRNLDQSVLCPKDLPPFDSAHSKLVERNIVSGCLMATLSKYSWHLMFRSAYNQMGRPITTSYPRQFVLAVGLSLFKKLKGSSNPSLVMQFRPVVIPYVHTLSATI